jgi:hypothetical protein
MTAQKFVAPELISVMSSSILIVRKPLIYLNIDHGVP